MIPMRRLDVEENLRFSGLVKRYHCWPVLRTQNVGEHTWHVMRIYWELFGSPPKEVWEAIMLHDVPEVGTADIPFHVKRRYPGLKMAFHEAENEWLSRMGITIPTLTDTEEVRVKVCDRLEMWEFGWEELNMGNKYAMSILDGIRGAVMLLVPSLPREDTTKVHAFMAKVANND